MTAACGDALSSDWIDRNFVQSLTIPKKVNDPLDGDTGRSLQFVSRQCTTDVYLGQKRTSTSLFDHLVGAQPDR
jgi:hypothetical protein